MQLVHGTAVRWGQAGLLLRGPSGSGKSDLALRLIESGARLIADDQVALACEHGEIWLQAPPAIAGMIEVRGLGILRLPRAPRTPLHLVCDLVRREQVERLPERGRCEYFGIAVPQVAFCAFDASTPAKLRFALRAVAGDAITVEPLSVQP
ncbi:MAG: HPr kinase/phosphatase C-terminal domain-containing protein [Alphaproteobacteria bacterium]|nr:HPr kinase/phosphatase C-terminal domain-containing protein [Alphaproteobacteria bacterium]